MIIFLFLLALICCYKLSFAGFSSDGTRELYFKDYLSIDKTNSIKGIFILIVFCSHIIRYLTLSDSVLDKSYEFVLGYIAQSMVAPFLFYSGYGIMLSIDRKGEAYVKGIPTKRFLRVLLHFDIAVLVFLLVQTILGKRFPLGTILLSFTGWDSLGNSNWYIFIVLCLYLITFAAFILFRKSRVLGVTAVIILSVLLVLFLYRFKEQFWYDTIPCYAFGMVFYLLQEKIEKVFTAHQWLYFGALLVTIGVIGATLLLLRGIVFLMIRHLSVILFIVLASMKISIHNKILSFFGKYLFEIYIFQRIPMIVLAHLGLSEKYIFFVVSFAITIVLALCFHYLYQKLDGVLFKTTPIANKNTA